MMYCLKCKNDITEKSCECIECRAIELGHRRSGGVHSTQFADDDFHLLLWNKPSDDGVILYVSTEKDVLKKLMSLDPDRIESVIRYVSENLEDHAKRWWNDLETMDSVFTYISRDKNGNKFWYKKWRAQ